MQQATYIASTVTEKVIILYFVFNELFHNSLMTLPTEVLFEQIALNKVLHTEVSS